ncbi:MAG: tRNA pseudouridine(13) synthase TruD [Chloroflexota bacterium]|nr:tRNA pseudouridine(13) synthase TruD [Chloroflexota bacterium]
MDDGLPMEGRYLTGDLPGIGGKIKVQPEDFVVEELPLYEPCGQGEHTYVRIEKRGLSTFEAVRAFARELRIPTRDIGYAGIKDAQAVARQTLSLMQVEPEEVEKLRIPNIKILWINRHSNKLRRGHLRGNRFIIRVRGVEESVLPRARQVLELLRRRGVPNHYGLQRFGHRANSHTLGRALLREDTVSFLAEFLGLPRPQETELMREARSRFDAGDWEGALELWPSGMANERRALRTLVETGDEARAVRSVPRRMRRFLLSAYQSHLFNRIVAARLGEIDRVREGDLAWKHDSGAVFLVEDAEAEQPRAERLKISPSGPIFGYKMLMPQGEPGRLEREVLEEEGLALEDFRRPRGLKAKGARRPLRVPLREAELWYNEGLMISFDLPSGSYATNVLREIVKDEGRR